MDIHDSSAKRDQALWSLAPVKDDTPSVSSSPVYHIVEQPGSIERMVEVEIPPEAYYEALRADMGERHSKVPWHVLDNMESLDAFLDVSIMAEFSYGAEKAKIMVAQGNLLGRVASREGVAADEERARAVRDFAPLRTKVHVQQFAGSTNWLCPWSTLRL